MNSGRTTLLQESLSNKHCVLRIPIVCIQAFKAYFLLGSKLVLQPHCCGNGKYKRKWRGLKALALIDRLVDLLFHITQLINKKIQKAIMQTSNQLSVEIRIKE